MQIENIFTKSIEHIELAMKRVGKNHNKTFSVKSKFYMHDLHFYMIKWEDFLNVIMKGKLTWVPQ